MSVAALATYLHPAVLDLLSDFGRHAGSTYRDCQPPSPSCAVDEGQLRLGGSQGNIRDSTAPSHIPTVP